MQTDYTGHVTSSEWRWVFFVSVNLLLLSFVTYIILAVFNPPGEDWQFLGALYDYQDTAASMSRMRQGAEGNLLVQFMHTPEDNPGILFQPIYALLGRISQVTLRSPLILYHLARMVAGLFMYLAIYQLGANIWVRITSRRVFFVLASISSGLGWLVALVLEASNTTIIPDLVFAQAYPFYAAAVNSHYPLAICSIALLASVAIPILRPNETPEPMPNNGALLAALVSIFLVLIYPGALLPFSLAFVLAVIATGISTRRWMFMEWRWGVWMIVPALPVAMYDIMVLRSNELVANWVAQRNIQVPSLPMLVIGLGLPLLVSIPALFRAVRRFEADGDRFMLLWLAMMVLTMYLPLGIRSYALAGIMLPMAYFTTRSIDDFWFRIIRRRYRRYFYIVGVPLLMLSHMMWLFAPVLPIVQGWSQVSGNVLEQGYVDIFEVLNELAEPGEVVLASPDVSHWIPVWTDTKTVYGHYAETYQADDKLNQVRNWYQADEGMCDDLLERYDVQFVIIGPREEAIGEAACSAELVLIVPGRISLYAVPDARILR